MFLPLKIVSSKRKRSRQVSPIEKKLESLEGRERMSFALNNPRSKFAAKVIRDGTIRVARSYSRAYKDRTGKLYWPERVRKHEPQFRSILRWCTDHGIRYDEWFRFCLKKYRAVLKSVPRPNNCCGEWIRAAWEEEHSQGSRHAGHTYEEVSTGIRGSLTAAGFDLAEYDDEMLRYLEERAGEKHTVPELYTPEFDTNAEAIVDWLVTHGES